VHQPQPDAAREHPCLPPVSALALALIELSPATPARLLAEHIDDGRGYCRCCSAPQAGPARWPCTLHNLSGAQPAVRY
jgi:hypothetical protein